MLKYQKIKLEFGNGQSQKSQGMEWDQPLPSGLVRVCFLKTDVVMEISGPHFLWP